MKKQDPGGKEQKTDDMLPEYDFSRKQGVRGKYYQAYRQGHAVRAREDDGTVTVRYFTHRGGRSGYA